MRVRIESPATIFDMAELGGASTQIHWAVVKEMWAGGETFSLRRGDDLLGVFGLYPVGTGAEAWFNILPAAAGHMLFLVRQIRLTLASRSYPEIVVICTTAAGRRIAAACGFTHANTIEGKEIWRYGRFARWIEQGSGPAEAAGGGTTAPDAGDIGLAAGGDRPGSSDGDRPENRQSHADISHQ